MIETAKAILARGDIVLIFPEGTRTRPGSLGQPKRGVGRLALETGVPVVPIAVIGTEAVRRGWRIRPHKVRIRAGRALRFPQVDDPSKALAGAVTDRIWPCVMLQWEWLGGLPPVRRVAIIGAGTWGTSLAVCLARAGLEVDLGCRTHEQALAVHSSRENPRYLPGVTLPESIRVVRAADLGPEGHDIVCMAVPAKALPAVLAAHGGRISSRIGVLVVSKGLVPPLATLPARSRPSAATLARSPCSADPPMPPRCSSTVPRWCSHRSTQRSRPSWPRRWTAGLDVSTTNDVTGVELAGCAKNAAVLAAAAAAHAGPNIAGAAAGKVFAEIDALARARGGRPETFAGLAGAGDLVATVVASGSRNRRAGELLAQGVSPQEIGAVLGHAAEAVDSVPLLADAARQSHLDSPALDGLAALVQGRIEPERWAATVTEPARPKSKRPVRAA